MAKGREHKFWTMGLLQSRGWTREQAQTLLPTPIYRTVGARRVRTWRREDVLRAEASEAFTPIITDAVRAAQIMVAKTYNFTPYVVASVLFILLSVPFILLNDWYSAKLRRREQTGGMV